MHCIGDSPSDIRGLAGFLVTLARRAPTPRRVRFDLEPVAASTKHHEALAGTIEGSHLDENFGVEHASACSTGHAATSEDGPQDVHGAINEQIVDLQASVKEQIEEMRSSLQVEMAREMKEHIMKANDEMKKQIMSHFVRHHLLQVDSSVS